MTNTINFNTQKIFPEYLLATSDQLSLATGESLIYDMKNISQKDQVVKLIAMSFEQVASVAVQMTVDGKPKNKLNVGTMGGITKDFEMFGAVHMLEAAKDRLMVKAFNNSGSASTDFRSRLVYIVDALDSATKTVLGIPLNKRDKEAIAILQNRAKQGLPPINFDEALKLGIGVPKQFEDFLKIHESIGSVYSSLPDSTNLSTTRSVVMNEIVTNPGQEALVLEALFVPLEAQATMGEVTVYITRDNDTDMMSFDPACVKADQGRIDLHIHAFKQLIVEVVQSSGTHNSYKMSAIASRRKVGIGFKAKLEEFLGRLPEPLVITPEEEAIIQQKNLRELARTGLLAIG